MARSLLGVGLQQATGVLTWHGRLYVGNDWLFTKAGVTVMNKTFTISTKFLFLDTHLFSGRRSARTPDTFTDGGG